MHDVDLPPASPSLRVHRVFNRLGVVLAVLCLLVAIGAAVIGILSHFNNNPTGAQFGLFNFIGWSIGALFLYVAARALGWIIAGAMRY